jgi:tRNA threonylcarbamoyladenosine biosynthesis protein TsaB
MRILALDSSLARCSVALVESGVLLATRIAQAARGQSALLAPMVAEILQSQSFDAIAVTIGPGSFTGLRAALALAHGLAADGRPVIGVTVAEALAMEVGPLDGRTLWTAIDSRRGRVFLDASGSMRPVLLTELPRPAGPVAIAGDAAILVAAYLAAADVDVRLTDARLPHAEHVAAVASLRLAGTLPPLDAAPLYIDPPEAKQPAGGLRPAPGDGPQPALGI